MKLKGTKTEKDFYDQLINQQKYLFQEIRLLELLRKIYPKMRTTYVLDWIPEQGEDIYTVLVNTDSVCEVELDRYDLSVEPIVKSVKTVTAFTKGLRKLARIKLEVAIDLAQKDMANN
ncbi:hypothetical protein OB236_09600 [Paenibacillus sp. WQ 127069]|uniref:DUF1499 domain-containing protein n=1 Tax=Paenibacillus baimaensis TaxID=2982185 RepID=A0ABT2UCR2_9BACL|nr:hypothetical protein [Paenibacillus sp. WQ 127069]MCU6792382.1 hypothetical protein [Paenibacillus sp. WQ 127069]